MTLKIGWRYIALPTGRFATINGDTRPVYVTACGGDRIGAKQLSIPMGAIVTRNGVTRPLYACAECQEGQDLTGYRVIAVPQGKSVTRNGDTRPLYAFACCPGPSVGLGSSGSASASGSLPPSAYESGSVSASAAGSVGVSPSVSASESASVGASALPSSGSVSASGILPGSSISPIPSSASSESGVSGIGISHPSAPSITQPSAPSSTSGSVGIQPSASSASSGYSPSSTSASSVGSSTSSLPSGSMSSPSAASASSGSSVSASSGIIPGGSTPGSSTPNYWTTYYYTAQTWICCSGSAASPAVNTLTYTSQSESLIVPTSENDCGDCSKAPASQLTFTLNGFTNLGCTDCTNLNGTWILDYKGACYWRSPNFTYCGNVVYFVLSSALRINNYVGWQLALIDQTADTEVLLFQTPLGSWDCQSSLTLTNVVPLSATYACNGWQQYPTIILSPITTPIGGSGSLAGSTSTQAVCTCWVCVSGTYGIWSVDLTGFGIYDGIYDVVWVGGCTWEYINSDGMSIILSYVGGEWELAVTVTGNSPYPSSISVTGVGACECPVGSSGSLSGSGSGSLSGSGSQPPGGSQPGGPSGSQSPGGSQPSSGGGGIVTACCPNPLPTTLYATVSGSVNSTVPLIYSGGVWIGTLSICGGGTQLTFICNSTPEFLLTGNGAYSFSVLQSTASCEPFGVSFTTSGVCTFTGVPVSINITVTE